MALVSMWPPANGALNTITFDGRTYTSTPGNSISVQDFDVPILHANGWQIANSTREIYLSAYLKTVYGDGIHDDTDAIQGALDSGAAHVIGWPGATYLVSWRGTLTVDTIVQGYCLSLPSNVNFDLNGATIKIKPGAVGASAIALAGGDALLVSNSQLRNGTIDGNNANMTYTDKISPCILFGHGSNIAIDNITVLNAYDEPGNFVGITQSRFTNMSALGSLANGWFFGGSDTLPFDMRLTACFIDNIYAERCRGAGPFGALAPGNPATFVVKDCVVGKCAARNCAGGWKIQDRAANSTFGQLLFDGAPVAGEANYGTNNSGTKLQADSPLIPAKITILSVVSQNCYGAGFFASGLTGFGCKLVDYNGLNNAGGDGTQPDVYISGCLNFSIGTIHSDGAGGAGAIYVDPTSDKFSCGPIYINNCTKSGAVGVNLQLTGQSGSPVAPADFSIGDVFLYDTIGNTNYTVFVNGSHVRGKTGRIFQSVPNNNTCYPIAAPSGTSVVDFGPAIMSSDPISGLVTLAANATSTAVANKNVWYINFSGTYVQPIIKLTPIGPNSQALGVMSVSFSSVGTTGFTIHHANTGTNTCKVIWDITGWKPLSDIYGTN